MALGANPNPIGITEITSAFQTGLVDVQASVVTFYLPSGLNKVAPVLTKVDMADVPGIIVINQGVWDKLSADNKAALERGTARRPASQLRQEIRGLRRDVARHARQGRRHRRRRDASRT